MRIQWRLDGGPFRCGANSFSVFIVTQPTEKWKLGDANCQGKRQLNLNTYTVEISSYRIVYEDPTVVRWWAILLWHELFFRFYCYLQLIVSCNLPFWLLNLITSLLCVLIYKGLPDVISDMPWFTSCPVFQLNTRIFPLCVQFTLISIISFPNSESACSILNREPMISLFWTFQKVQCC